MVARKKITKQRGKRTHGWGSQKKHRGGGSRGGRGNSGNVDHKKTWLWKRGRKLGNTGFKSLEQRGLRKSGGEINLRDIERMAGDKNEINLVDHGYERVLGTGEIKRPLKITARHFSASAEEKIKKVKGEAVRT